MPRKFVTGDDRHVKVQVKREMVEAKCQGCGEPVTIPNDHAGDILCAKCSQGCSYSMEYVDELPEEAKTS